MIRLKSLLLENLSTSEKTVMDFLISSGLTSKQAAGIAGNLKQESTFRPKADNKKSQGEFGEGHFGIAQWDKKYRWPAVKKWMIENEYDPYTLSGQLNALRWEAKKRRDWDKIKETKTPEASAAAWLKWFERSGEKPGQAGYDKRVMYANEIYEDYSNVSADEENTVATSSKSKDVYIVQSGDTLSSIAAKQPAGITAKTIAIANDIDIDNPIIKPGQELKIK